jgi:hypothetical protein
LDNNCSIKDGACFTGKAYFISRFPTDFNPAVFERITRHHQARAYRLNVADGADANGMADLFVLNCVQECVITSLLELLCRSKKT